MQASDWSVVIMQASDWSVVIMQASDWLQALDTPPPPHNPSVWSRVATNEVLLYDVLYGEYFKEPSESNKKKIVQDSWRGTK